MSRIIQTFLNLKKINKQAFVSFIVAGDPDIDFSQKILNSLPDCGVDIIELGMPFTDPMADGSVIQLANMRSLENSHTMAKTFDMVKKFRENNQHTPVVLMGYYNPVFVFGIKNFLKEAARVGIDGVIIVDLPPEEEAEFTIPAQEYNVDLVRLITPTTDINRIRKIIKNVTGFLYYVSVNGVTGSRSFDYELVHHNVSQIKSETNLPIVVGFGISSPEHIVQLRKTSADGFVVGSSIVNKIASMNINTSNLGINSVLDYIKSLSYAVKDNV